MALKRYFPFKFLFSETQESDIRSNAAEAKSRAGWKIISFVRCWAKAYPYIFEWKCPSHQFVRVRNRWVMPS